MTEHPSISLWREHQRVAPYPDGVIAVPEAMKGTAFFPGGFGLSRDDGSSTLPTWPRAGVMVLGHDFHSEAGYCASVKRGGESPTLPTWRNLRSLFESVSLPLRNCFFTNAYMGLRKGKETTGPFPGRNDPEFVERCMAFLEVQISAQAPRLVITLGKPASSLLATRSIGLVEWRTASTFVELDRVGPLRERVDFKGGVQATVVALVHPSLRHLSIRTRQFGNHRGPEAELAMLKEAILTSGVGAA